MMESANDSTHSTTSSFSLGGCCLNLLSYFRSIHFLELIASLIFCVLTLIIPFFAVSNYERAVPYQTTAANDILLNLENAQELKEETISDGVLIVICVLVPILLQLFIVLVNLGESGMDAHKTICVYAIGIGLTSLIVELVKNYCGYLRPNFYELCQPDWDNLDANNGGGGANKGGNPACMEEDMTNGYKSFPSGHASISFAGCTTFTLYLLRNFGVNRHNGLQYVQVVQRRHSSMSNSNAAESTPPLDEEEVAANGEEAERDVKMVLQYQHVSNTTLMLRRVYSLICVLPMVLAFYVSASRVRDNFHFPADVVAGSLIGYSCSSFAHSLWFSPFPSQ